MSTSLDRALDVLALISTRPQGPAELGEKLGVHRSTIVRILQTLEARSYARRLATGKWGLGFGLIAMGQSALERIDVREVARPHLVALGAELGHTIHLASLNGSEVVYVDKVEGRGAMKMQSRIGGRALVHTAGVAKAILAYAPEPVRAAALSSCSFERFTATTITSQAELVLEFDRIVERGWAVDDGEAENYINCVALPIFGNDGSVVAGLSVTALKALAPLSVLEGHIGRIRNARDCISVELGWQGAANDGTKSA